MAGITGKSCVALFPLCSLKKNACTYHTYLSYLLPYHYRYCISELFEIRKQKQNTSISETFAWVTKNYSHSWRGCLLKKSKRIVWYFYSCFTPLKWTFSTISLICGLKKLRILKWIQNGFIYSISVLYFFALIPAPEKVIKPRP